MPRICFSLWSGWPNGWGAPGKRKTRGQNSPLPGPEQGLGSRPPASQRGIPRLRNTHTFASPTSPVARVWCKIRANCLQAPLDHIPASPGSTQLCSSQPKGTTWAKGCSFPLPRWSPWCWAPRAVPARRAPRCSPPACSPPGDRAATPCYIPAAARAQQNCPDPSVGVPTGPQGCSPQPCHSLLPAFSPSSDPPGSRYKEGIAQGTRFIPVVC